MRSILLALLSVCFIMASAQSGNDSSTLNVLRDLAKPDSVTGAVVKVSNSPGIVASLMDRSARHVVKSSSGQGYRIQVFSSNVHRTAKTEAFNIEKELTAAFPETGVYVTYTSPFWKVRVGDFKTTEDAREFSEELVAAFPSLKATTYIVKDKVNF